MQLNIEYPVALWGLLAVGVWALVALRNRRRAQPSFSWRKLITISLALSAGVLALSRPQLGRRVSVTRAAGQNIFFAIDISQSMLVEDVPPNRLHFATSAVQLVIEALEGARVAIFPFAADGYIQIPLTTDREAIHSTIPILNPSMTTAQGTDFGASLDTLLTAIQQMEAQASQRGEDWPPTQVILLSDGETHHKLDEAVLGKFRSLQVPIHAIGVATASGGIVPAPRKMFGGVGPLRDRDGRTATSRLGEKDLRRIASVTGGEYVTASLEAVNGLAGRLRQSGGLSQVSTKLEVDRELYSPLLFLAFLLFFLELSLGRWEYAIRGFAAVALLLAPLLASPARAEPDVEPLEARLNETKDNETRAILKYNIGSQHWKAGRKARAAEAFQEAAFLTEQARVRKKALYNYGNAQLDLMDPQSAIAAYQEAYDIKLDSQKDQKALDKNISENIALASRLLQQMQSQKPEQGEGNGNGEPPPDPGKAKKDYQAERFSADRKQRIFEVISNEEQQILAKLQRKRAGKEGVIPEERPW